MMPAMVESRDGPTMLAYLTPTILKSGEALEVVRVLAPCGEWAEQIVRFMYVRHIEYANCSWHRNCERAVAGEFVASSRDVFFVGLIDGEIVGACWYATPADTGELATFGRVVTAPEHRRKGISTVLSQAAVDDFCAGGGWCMNLATTRTNPARLVYESLGFAHHNYVEGRGTIMRLMLHGDPVEFEHEYFDAGRLASIRPLYWGDLPRAEVLYNLPHWFLKDYSLGIYANTPFEGQFFDIMEGVEAFGDAAQALVARDNRLVGMAYTSHTRAQAGAQEHVRFLEFLVHPSYISYAPQLLAATALESPGQKLLSFSSALDVSRSEALEEAGFVQETVLKSCLQDMDAQFDLYIYSLVK